jgi:hypothetical protein
MMLRRRMQEWFFIVQNRIVCEAPGGVGIGLEWTNDSLIEGNMVIGAGNERLGEGIAFTGSPNRIVANQLGLGREPSQDRRVCLLGSLEGQAPSQARPHCQTGQED